jgi:NAD(P)-dependent dehydrogenase (short-subunit alcohol dehydrogenase family)
MTRPVVMVTGGAKRIGAAIARSFSDAGWHVVIHYVRSRAQAEELAQSLPSAEAIHCDLTDSDAALALVAHIAARHREWRVLVNSAAMFSPDQVTDLDPKTYERTMAFNTKTPIRMAQAFLRLSQARGGRRVIQLTDQKVANLNPDFFSYTLSKAAVTTATRMLAMGAPRGDDRVYALAPGLTLPSHDQTAEEFEISGRMNLLQRLNSPEEIGEAALFLAEGHLASGETLYADSGQHLLSHPRDVMYLVRGEN